MCGIAGIIIKNAGSYEKQIEKMISSLRHRGPDGEGEKYFQNCVLGHTRLSIIDHDCGRQPMTSSASLKSIVFNGEIYGYKDIRDSLLGYQFKTQSDTEVILALFESDGEGCLEKLPGMFSFAIWDDENQILFAARDRFGEKPFYYAMGKNGEFIFASEIKAILATGLVTPVLDLDSLRYYLQYLYVHPTKTIYSNVFTLPPAHYLLFKNGTISIHRYWTFPEMKDSITMEQAIEQFRKLFDNSVKKQLVADVPVGAFLSGGLDSSTIVAIASRYSDRLQTFSFGFEDSVSELPYAIQIAKKYGTNHHELTEKNFDIAELLITLSDVYDEPFADSSNIPTYLIAKHSRQYLKVVLTGDGGDELLGGYWWWYYPLLDIGNPQNETRIQFLQFIAKLLFWLHTKNAVQWQKKINCLKTANLYHSIKDAHTQKSQYFSEIELKNLFLNYVMPKKIGFLQSWKETNTVNDAMMMDLENYMAGDILVKTDRASMAHGLELRSPFLDVEFASFCVSLPAQLKITKDEDKIILRRAYEELWTEQIQKRGKQGFGAPVEEWLKKKSVQELKVKYLNDQNLKLYKILSFDAVKYISQKDTFQTYILLVLSIWMERHEFIM